MYFIMSIVVGMNSEKLGGDDMRLLRWQEHKKKITTNSRHYILFTMM